MTEKIKDFYSVRFGENIAKLKTKAEDYINVLDGNAAIQNKLVSELEKANSRLKSNLIAEFTRFVNNSDIDYDSISEIKQYGRRLADAQKSITSSCKIDKKYEVDKDVKQFESSESVMKKRTEDMSLKILATNLDIIGEHKFSSVLSDQLLISYEDFQQMHEDDIKKSGEKMSCS